MNPLPSTEEAHAILARWNREQAEKVRNDADLAKKDPAYQQQLVEEYLKNSKRFSGLGVMKGG